jgi:hypothetical protein
MSRAFHRVVIALIGLDLLVWGLVWLGPVALSIYFDFSVLRVVAWVVGGFLFTVVVAGLSLMILATPLALFATMRYGRIDNRELDRFIPYLIGLHILLPIVAPMVYNLLR